MTTHKISARPLAGMAAGMAAVMAGILLASGTAAFAQGGLAPGIHSQGMLPGHIWSDAWAISPDGVAFAGYSSIAADDRATRWTEAGGLEDLGTTPAWDRTWAWGASNGGEVIVGYGEHLPTYDYRGFRWTAAGGFEDLGVPPGYVEVWVGGVSADGNVIVGDVTTASGANRAFRWTVGEGYVLLPLAPGFTRSFAAAVNSDGSVIIGSHRAEGSASRWRLMRWTETGGSEDVAGMLAPNGMAQSVFPNTMSENGSVIVGDAEFAEGFRVYRWTQQTGFVAIPALPPLGNEWVYGFGGATSSDGSVVVGRSTYRAFMWTQELGTVDLNIHAPAQGIDLTGWKLSEIMDVSADGLAMAGNGTFNNQSVGFRLVLPGPKAPCYANCTGSTTEPLLTVDDFTCFINEFAAASALPPAQQIEHYANCDGSTQIPVLTVDDFTCFINEFAVGCP